MICPKSKMRRPRSLVALLLIPPLPVITVLTDLVNEVTELKKQMQLQQQYNVIGDMSRCDNILVALKTLLPENVIGRIQCGEKKFHDDLANVLEAQRETIYESLRTKR
eukprot:GHVR01163760.1.p1 GENE.GHVR01163760.1~~GHVR01163760.1.p1  ORF type:complete len:108 (-),score=13.67 GHVR01163760.1:368-691(-)